MRILDKRPRPIQKRTLHHKKPRLKTVLCRSCQEGKHHCHSLWCRCEEC